MPDFYRVGFFFEGRGHGWSETLVLQRDGVNPTAISVIAAALALLRAPLLGKQYTLIATRCALVRTGAGDFNNEKNRVKLNEWNMKPSQLVANDGDEVNQCVKVQFSDAGGNRKKTLYLGGIPDGINTEGGVLNPNDNGWQSRFNQWATAILAPNNWGYFATTPGAFGNVTGYTTTTFGVVTLTVDQPVFGAGPWPKSQVVRIKKLNGKSALNKALLVQALSATTCQTITPIAVLGFKSPGVLTVYSYPFVGMGGGTIEAQKIVEHKRGRPLFSSRGRLPVQTRV